MIIVENIKVDNIEIAIRGMRNPMNSWEKSDSRYCINQNKYKEIDGIKVYEPEYIIGENDLDLMKRLFRAGTEHRKFLRQIFVSMDITCHHTWWAEFDTYKVGITRNSCSKMHKVHVKEFTIDDFSHEGITEVGGKTMEVFETVIETLEALRVEFNETNDKKYWRAMIDLLPMGFYLKATITMNYENIFNIIHQRSHHKLTEWVEFVDILKRDLPIVSELLNEAIEEDV